MFIKFIVGHNDGRCSIGVTKLTILFMIVVARNYKFHFTCMSFLSVYHCCGCMPQCDLSCGFFSVSVKLSV